MDDVPTLSLHVCLFEFVVWLLFFLFFFACPDGAVASHRLITSG